MEGGPEEQNKKNGEKLFWVVLIWAVNWYNCGYDGNFVSANFWSPVYVEISIKYEDFTKNYQVAATKGKGGVKHYLKVSSKAS